jgi:hypothetical protein
LTSWIETSAGALAAAYIAGHSTSRAALSDLADRFSLTTLANVKGCGELVRARDIPFHSLCHLPARGLLRSDGPAPRSSPSPGYGHDQARGHDHLNRSVHP